MRGEVSVDTQVICYILTNYEQKLHDSPITSGSESLLNSNPSLSVSIATGDHNFPDLKDYALAAFKPVEVATLKVSLSDLLNPTPEDHSTDTSSINTWGSEPDNTSLDKQRSVDVMAAKTSSCYSYAKSVGSDVSFNGAPSVKEMFVDSSSTYSDVQSGESPASESGSELPSDAQMDVDDVGIGSLPEKKSATLLSFFKHKAGIDKSDKLMKNVVTALKRHRTSSDSCESDLESDNYHRRAGKL